MSSASFLRPQLNDALDGEVRRLDLLLVRAWQLLAAAGVLIGLAVGVFFDYRHGPASALVCAVGFAWFTLQARWLARTKSTKPIVWGTLFEATLPPIFLVVIARTQGADYALGSYVPPMVFAALVLAGAARLRPWPTFFVGVFQGVALIILYYAVLRGMIPEARRDDPLLSPGMQWSRALSYVLGGGVTWVVTRALRQAIGRAERSVRALDLFGKYRLEAKVGSGGMGVVHRATYCPEGGFERTVAVKMLHPHLLDDPRFIAAFREEAELSARLLHDNIVQVLDFGRVEDAYFLAMEYVDGLTLSELQRRLAALGRTTSEATAAWIGSSILSGLSYAHAVARDARGDLLHVVHRDLCPSNLLVTWTGDVKISDFGVAKALRDAAFSQTNTIFGHVGYIAPEQARGEPVDERSDLFAVGVILWEVLAQQSLFRKGADATTLLSVMRGDVTRIRLVRPEVREGWEAFFDRALAMEPQRRFATAEEMRRALSALVDGADRQRPPELAQLLAEVRETRAIDRSLPPADTRSTVIDRPGGSAPRP